MPRADRAHHPRTPRDRTGWAPGRAPPARAVTAARRLGLAAGGRARVGGGAEVGRHDRVELLVQPLAVGEDHLGEPRRLRPGARRLADHVDHSQGIVTRF
ncbi:hypothetical protein [Saccharothrix australiensis]|uniref:hypothetical protein n=1 Tax=Saccharothrix australiensis TaxID=2072 RepID=UPI0011C43A8E|nr:hypothetical protein [Saccharothrix australiensis]